MILELNAPVLFSSDTEITLTVNFSFGSSNAPVPSLETISEIESGGGLYGANDGYGNFVYGGTIVSEIHTYMDGMGANMSPLITFKSRNDNPFSFKSAIIDYRNLGIKRQN